MQIMRNLSAEGKSILFISHKLNEIMAVADRCTVLRKGKCIGTVNTADTQGGAVPHDGRPRRGAGRAQGSQGARRRHSECRHMTVASKMHKNNAVKNVSLHVRSGEIVCIAGIDGNGQTELVYGLTGLEPLTGGSISLCGQDITHASISSAPSWA
jgi:simple sugar transport system ATP-binding protein